jgi:hypothetical protein
MPHEYLSPGTEDHFASELLTRFVGAGFGTMPKREVELLVFFLLTLPGQPLADLTTYELANKLRITEKRILSLREEAAVRYGVANAQEQLRRLVSRIFATGRTRPELIDGRLAFQLDDPVMSREYENAVTSAGYTIEYGNNRRIVSVEPHVFLAVMRQVFPEVEDHFVRVAKVRFKGKKGSEELLDKALPFSDRVAKFIQRTADPIGALASILSFALPGA